MVRVETGNTPNVLSGSLLIQQFTKQSVTTGTALRRNFGVGSGSTTLSNTGTTVSTKVPAAGYVVFTGTGGQAKSVLTDDAVLKVWMHSKHGR
jgi:hypothetical protein